MVVTFILGFICVVLLWFYGKSNNLKFIKSAFVLLFVYLALRYDFGNDYISYLEMFETTSQSSWAELSIISIVNQLGETLEFGFLYLMKFFSLFTNFYVFIAFHSLLFCFIYYHLIVKYVDKRYAWLAIFILIFHTGLMVRSLSGLRQALSVFCFIYSIRFLIKRDFIKYMILILTASIFHYSAIILLPLYFVINTRVITKFEIFFYISLYLFMVFASEIFLVPIALMVDAYLPKYNTYLEGGDVVMIGTGLGMLADTIIYFYIIIFAGKKTPAERVLFRVFLIFMILTPSSLLLNHLFRLTLYFAPALITIIPNSLSRDQNPLSRIMISLLVITILSFTSIGHYRSPVFKEKNYFYKSVFSIK